MTELLITYGLVQFVLIFGLIIAYVHERKNK